MITFQANLINTTRIQKYTGKQGYQYCNAQFVQLNPNPKSSDIRAVREVNFSWDHGRTYAGDIMTFFRNCWIAEDNNPREKFFALTRQKKNFEDLKSEEIIGLAQVTDDNTGRINLEYLQVDPDTKYKASDRPYKKVGQAIIKSLETLFSGKRMVLSADKDAEEFYEKLGFEWNTTGLLTKNL